jgi:NAD(P)-dependent dehydrogenase (short-subunit alcohol dehydrogenase family)
MDDRRPRRDERDDGAWLESRGRGAPLIVAAVVAAAAAGVALLARARTPAYGFAGRVVLVTGGSRGLGLVLARRLVRDGASVALMARDAGELARARSTFPTPASVLTIAGDVRRQEDCDRAVADTLERFGRLDVLVNNAGVIVSAPLGATTDDDFQWLMDVHCWGTLRMTRAAVPALSRRAGARVVNICSIGGKVPVPHLAAYSASKFAQAGLSAVLAQELAADGITVSTVYPGLMRAGSHLHARFRGQLRTEFGAFALASGLPGVSMSVERAARLILAAVRRGQAEIVVPFTVRQIAAAAAVAPNVAARVLRQVARTLPAGPGGIHRGVDAPPTRGADIGLPPLVRAAVVLSERAATRNNERGAPGPAASPGAV